METRLPEDGDQAPNWRHTTYEVWYRDPEVVVSNMLSSPDFDGQFDLCPYIDLDADGNRRWSNVMSANIAWRRCVSTKHMLDKERLLFTLPDTGRNYHDHSKRRGRNVLPDHPWER
jgi:hypothetical protein